MSIIYIMKKWNVVSSTNGQKEKKYQFCKKASKSDSALLKRNASIAKNNSLKRTPTKTIEEIATNHHKKETFQQNIHKNQ